MKKYLFWIIIVIVIVISLGAYLHHQSPTKKTSFPSFRLISNSWVGYGPFWLAQEKGFFRDEGVDVHISVIDDTAQRKSVILKGDADGSGDTIDLLVLARDEQVPSVAVMQLDVSKGADGIVASNNIKTIEDLKGTTIAAQKNFVDESFLYYLLQKHGMSPKDVTVVDTESGAAGAAFVAGSVDVAATYEPWLSKAKDRKDGHVLVSTKDYPDVLVDILTIRQQYLHDHSDVVKKVMRAWFKAVDYWQHHQQEANMIMAKHYNVSPQEFADMITGLYWPTIQQNQLFFGETTKGRYWDVADTFANVFLSTGQIKSKPDMTKATDVTLLNKLNQ